MDFFYSIPQHTPKTKAADVPSAAFLRYSAVCSVSAACSAAAAASRSALRFLCTVSYTHLDVYKRQMQMGADHAVDALHTLLPKKVG